MDAPQGSIVVGMDRSPDSRRGLDWATAAALGRSAPLHLLHAIPPPFTDLPPTAAEYRALREDADRLLREARDRVAPSGVGPITTEVVERHPVVALVEASRHAGVVVIGSRGHGMAYGTLLGSVSQQVSRHAHCPVVVVRAPADPNERRIVVGVDGSPHSDHAIGFAVEIAARNRIPLLAVHGFKDRATTPSGLGAPDWSGTLRRIEAGQDLLRAAVAPWEAKYPEAEITLEAAPLPPVRLLVDASARAALVVVGSRGHSELADLLLGSVSQSLLHHAGCPVAVVR